MDLVAPCGKYFYVRTPQDKAILMVVLSCTCHKRFKFSCVSSKNIHLIANHYQVIIMGYLDEKIMSNTQIKNDVIQIIDGCLIYCV